MAIRQDCNAVSALSNLVDDAVEKIESEVPADSIFTAHSVFKFRFKKVPSDYREVVVKSELRIRLLLPL